MLSTYTPDIISRRVTNIDILERMDKLRKLEYLGHMIEVKNTPRRTLCKVTSKANVVLIIEKYFGGEMYVNVLTAALLNYLDEQSIKLQ